VGGRWTVRGDWQNWVVESMVVARWFACGSEFGCLLFSPPLSRLTWEEKKKIAVAEVE